MRKFAVIVALSLCTHATFGFQASNDVTPTAQPSYIKENLIIYMRSGPSDQYRLIGSISAGETINIVTTNDDGSFTQVQDNKGREGWIESKWITNEPPAEVAVAEYQTQISRLTEEKNTLATQLDNAQLTHDRQLANIDTLNEKITQQAQEIAQLSAQVEQQSGEELRAWLTRGGILVAGSIVLGMLLTMLPRGRKRNDGWV